MQPLTHQREAEEQHTAAEKEGRARAEEEAQLATDSTQAAEVRHPAPCLRGAPPRGVSGPIVKNMWAIGC